MDYPLTLEIENAEVLILRLCKTAIELRYSKDKFKNEVDKLINSLCEKVSYNYLKDKIRASLRAYAERCYAKERRIYVEMATMYSVLLVGIASNKREAKIYKRDFDKNTSKDFRHSSGFLSLVEQMKPHTMYPTSLPLDMYHKKYMERVETLTKELAESNAKEDYKTNVSLRNIAEMTIRYEHQLEMIDEKRRSGKKLVYILAHSNCSKRCEKYQVGGTKHSSGLYSLDGTSGITEDGIKYVPLEFATHNPEDLYTTKAGVTYQNGCLTGFNCRHKLGDYIPGVKPEAIPDEVIEKRRNLEEKQREYERQIRKYKKTYVLLQDVNPYVANKYKKFAQDKEEEYRKFSQENDIAFYSERIKILDSDQPNVLTKSNKNDKINLDLFSYTDKQLGAKLGRHAKDFKIDPSKPEGRHKFLMTIYGIVEHAEEIRTGFWRGQPKDVFFYICGKDVVILNQNNEFVSILEGGVDNARVKNSRIKKI